MIVKINGEILNPNSHYPQIINKNKNAKINWKIPKVNLNKLAITLWTVTGALFYKKAQAAAGFEVWDSIRGTLFLPLQDVIMVLGSLALFAALLTMIFKKSLGMKMIQTTAIVVIGCFLIPSIMMLVAIIGTSLNWAFEKAFEQIDIKNSVKVGN